MKHHKINKLNNFIGGYYLEDTSICDDLINFFNENENRIERGTCYNSKEGAVDLEIKDSYDVALGANDEIANRYVDTIQPCLLEYLEQYSFAEKTGVFKVYEHFNVQYYKPNGGFFEWHCENPGTDNKNIKRHLVFMTYLNDVTDGGETEFYYQDIKVKPEKGLTLIWGSSWMHTHRGIKSPTQEKYIATGWYSFNLE